jgi:secreted PhoX family phosphatase
VSGCIVFSIHICEEEAMAKQDEDTVCNRAGNAHLTELIDMQRRRVLQGGTALAVASFFGLPDLNKIGQAFAAGPLIGFSGIPVSSDDLVHLPSGYTLQVLYAWGDPVSSGPAFQPDASNSAQDQELQAGMHHDGMHFFPIPYAPPGKPASSKRGILCVNHEYTDDGLLHVGGMEDWTAEKVKKSQAAHGVSIVEVRFDEKKWEIVRPSRFARRLTAYTPMRISGPAARHELLKTAADPFGRRVLGTLNNCAHGYTPWGTYLTCEENWNGYFSNETGEILDDSLSPEQKAEILEDHSRYGITKGGFGYRWHEHDERFRADLHPNEPNRFGWVVEVDPYDRRSVPKKRTALGRIKHEGAAVTLSKDRRAVVYMGDDERNEYIYKFVSRGRFDKLQRKANFELLDRGTLYVARFEAGAQTGDGAGSGRWIPLVWGQNGLTPENGFRDQAEVLVKTRQAADRVGATMMDRPEWIAVHPKTQEVYVTLTNNNRRGTQPPSGNREDGTTAAGSARPPVDEANPRPDNRFGHIVRWREAGGDPAAMTFEWDIFVLCGDPAQSKPEYQGDIRGDAFGSPDGLWFDPDGRLWIQTDVSTSVLGKNEYANLGNNQMLCADPESKEIRRFLTAPKGCEVTGVISTPDGSSLFVNIQHPGEPASERSDPAAPEGVSAWPSSQGYGPKGRPRSATIVIRKSDGGVVGT